MSSVHFIMYLKKVVERRLSLSKVYIVCLIKKNKMTHLKTPDARKKFIKKQLKEATPRAIARIYNETEKAVGFYKKK